MLRGHQVSDMLVCIKLGHKTIPYCFVFCLFALFCMCFASLQLYWSDITSGLIRSQQYKASGELKQLSGNYYTLVFYCLLHLKPEKSWARFTSVEACLIANHLSYRMHLWKPCKKSNFFLSPSRLKQAIVFTRVWKSLLEKNDSSEYPQHIIQRWSV